MYKEIRKDLTSKSEEKEFDIKEDQFVLPARINFFISSHLANVIVFTMSW